MVKFSSLSEFRLYVENLPLDYILKILLSQKGLIFDGIRDSPRNHVDYPSNRNWRSSSGIDLEKHIGELIFRLNLHTGGSVTGVTTTSLEDYNYERSVMSGNLDYESGVYNVPLSVSYIHAINDIWIIPLHVTLINKIRINSDSALERLYYTPEVPLFNYKNNSDLVDRCFTMDSLVGEDPEWEAISVLFASGIGSRIMGVTALWTEPWDDNTWEHTYEGFSDTDEANIGFDFRHNLGLVPLTKNLLPSNRSSVDWSWLRYSDSEGYGGVQEALPSLPSTDILRIFPSDCVFIYSPSMPITFNYPMGDFIVV